jgi:phage terminase large subunit GpA-like protein
VKEDLYEYVEFESHAIGFMIQKGLAPNPEISVSEWADKNRYLSVKGGAAFSQKWKTSKVPYTKFIMDALTPGSPWTEVRWMKATQVAGTEVGNNFVGCVIEHYPANIMYVMPTVDTLKKNSKLRLDTLFEDTPSLRELVKEKRSRDSGNTLLMKEYPNGAMVLTGGNSAAGMRSIPARYLFLDEIDAFPDDVDGEGDPISLLRKRMNAQGDRKKVFMVSSPTVKGKSRIERELRRGQLHNYFVPCLFCGEYQILIWDNLSYEIGEQGEALDVGYKCSVCEGKHYEYHKTEMLERGEWRLVNSGPDKKALSVHTSSLYSPVGFFSWEECVNDYLASYKDQSTYKTHINTIRGEVWEENLEMPDWEKLPAKEEDYEKCTAPVKGILIGAVDRQGDRFEIHIWLWTKNREKYVVDYRVVPADMKDLKSYDHLNRLLDEEFIVAGRAQKIKVLSVDTGGHDVSVCYDWYQINRSSRILLVKGSSHKMQTVLEPPKPTQVNKAGKRIYSGVKVWMVGTNVIKSEIYSALKIPKSQGPEYPYGYIHFPRNMGDEYYQQLTSEALKRTRTKSGVYRYDWEKVRNRNEALDTTVYAWAGAAFLQLDRYTDETWDLLWKTETAPKSQSTPNKNKGGSGGNPGGRTTGRSMGFS